jgi:cytochrome b561/polyisoprenoid-binding protein YceI
MIFKNTPERFGIVAKSFHWIMALLIFGLLTVGYVMAGMVISPQKLDLIYLHKSFGTLVLMLAVARLGWRFFSPRPARDPRVKPWEDKLATIVHGLLYVAVFAMPLSGWVMSSAGDYPASFFGLFALPPIVPKNEALMMAAKEVHEFLAIAILILLALHFAGAAKHHVIDGDDTLRRMTFQNLTRAGGLVLLGILGLIYLAPVAVMVLGPEDEERVAQTVSGNVPVTQTQSGDTDWCVLPESAIEFEATQYGQTFKGAFKNFTAAIRFNPDDLTASQVLVAIPVSGITTGDSNRDTQARSADWFNEAQFPQAVFQTSLIEKTEGTDQYKANGSLTLRGISKEIDLPFTLTITEQNGTRLANMTAEIEIKRLDFGIGQGQWAKTDVIGDTIRIFIRLQATPLAPVEESR